MIIHGVVSTPSGETLACLHKAGYTCRQGDPEMSTRPSPQNCMADGVEGHSWRQKAKIFSKSNSLLQGCPSFRGWIWTGPQSSCNTHAEKQLDSIRHLTTYRRSDRKHNTLSGLLASCYHVRSSLSAAE